MKKHLLKTIALLLCLACIIQGCKKEKETVPMASLSINVEATTSSSITFSIDADENTSAFYYSCVKTGDSENFIYVDDPESNNQFLVENLLSDTEYTISAKAENRIGQQSERVIVKAVTNANASIEIKIEEVVPNKVTFTLDPLNASRYYYAVATSDKAESVELNTIESSEAQKFEVDVEPNTSYTVVAQAENEQGELSERIYSSFKTGYMPNVEIGDVYADETSVIVSLEHSDAVKILYAINLDSKTEPEEFSEIAINGTYPENLYFYELETDKTYTVWVCAENRDGYRSDYTKADAVTSVQESRPLSVSINNITSVDASIDVSFDKSVYSCCHYYMDKPENIDPASFAWEEMINTYQTAKLYNPGTQKLSRFPDALTTSGTHRVGIIGVDLEGKIVPESAIWRDITLKSVDFGESNASVSIEKVDVKYNLFKYKVKSENAAGYYMDYASEIEDVEFFAKEEVLRASFKSEFDVEEAISSLKQKTEYTMVLIPVDAEGKLGDIITYSFETKPIEHNGLGVAEVTLSRTTVSSFAFDIKLDENTESVKYKVFKESDVKDESLMIEELATVWSSVKENSELELKSMGIGEKYHIWFMSVDKNGDFGPVIKFEETTLSGPLDGNADFEVVIDEFVPGSNPMINKVSYTVTPGSNCKGFYYVVCSYTVLDSEDLKAAEVVINTGKFSKEKISLKNVTAYKDYHIGIVAIDTDNKLSAPYFLKVE